MKKVDIVKFDFSTGNFQKMTDYVAEEKPLHIFINRKHYATILCSPSNLNELAVGHLLTAGIIKSAEEVEEISLNNHDVCQVKLKPEINLRSRLKVSRLYSRIILSACGSTTPYTFAGKLPKVASNIKVKAQLIRDCVNRLNAIAETFRKTGGVHAAAIYKTDGSLVAFAEDVGRHNAVDKVIGIGALYKVNFTEYFLAVSGRLTGDMVYKTAKVGLPIVASLAAALDSGVEIAKASNLTLIGFVRGKHMNIYTFPERIG